MNRHAFADIRIPIEGDNPAIVRDESLCIKCGGCRRVCEREIAVGRLYDLLSTGDTAICIHCGQCANACPVDSITEAYEYSAVRDAVRDPDKVVIFSTSPSVRVGLGESFGLPAGAFVEGQMVAALRALGADYVLDTNFSADLTIMEEASELVERITKKAGPLPQFTSCCPAWVKFAETFYPEILPHISSAKSPIGMQGPTVKTYFAARMGIDPAKIVNVAVTPCTAKKFEIRRPEMAGAARETGVAGLRDMDHVITTRELAKWLKEEGVDFAALPESGYDSLMGAASGAGVIFGNTGGVMEAAARTAYWLVTGKNPPADYLNLTPVRGMDGVRTARVEIAGVPLTLAVVHGTANAKLLIEEWKAGRAGYDFVEVMTCRGGCIGGGGQPKTEIPMSDGVRSARIDSLYARDGSMSLRFSHENPDIRRVYEEYYGAPLSRRAEDLLHTAYINRAGDLGPSGMVEKPLTEYPAPGAAPADGRRWRCTVCGCIHEGDAPPAECPVCHVGANLFEEMPPEAPAPEASSAADRRWRCTVCGYIHEGDAPPAECPVCHVGAVLFSEIEQLIR